VVEGPDFDGFPAISKTRHYNNGINNDVALVLYFISIGQGQQVPQLWQVDLPEGDNKKQVICYSWR
jgi:hypothetical protein